VSLLIVSIMAPLWLSRLSNISGRRKFRSEQEDPNGKKRAASADDRCPNVLSSRIVHISRAAHGTGQTEADGRIRKDGSFGSKRAMCSAE
jgi:hypothetical protein